MIFLSHSWSQTTNGKDIHFIVSVINRYISLYECTWFDEEKIVYDIDGSIVQGITNCSMFVCFLTKSYIDKVCDAECNPNVRDNCYKEFSYAQLCKKPCVVVILEKELLNVSNWRPGIVKLYLGNKLYIDGTSLNPQEASLNVMERYYKITKPKSLKSFSYKHLFQSDKNINKNNCVLKSKNERNIKTIIYV
jgi:hypothetical protein